MGFGLDFSSSTQNTWVNDGLIDVGGGVNINPTVSPTVSGGQGNPSSSTSQGGTGKPASSPTPSTSVSGTPSSSVLGMDTNTLLLVLGGIFLIVLVRH